MTVDSDRLVSELERAADAADRLQASLRGCLERMGRAPRRDGATLPDTPVDLTGEVRAPSRATGPGLPRRPPLRVVGRAGQPVTQTAAVLTGALDLDGFRVDAGRHLVEVDGRQARLTPNEWQLFAAMLAEPHRVISREELAIAAWGNGYAGRVGEVEVYISRLRRKLEQNPRSPLLIETVRGAGYRLVTPPAEVEVEVVDDRASG